MVTPSKELREASDFVVAVRRYIDAIEKPLAERNEFVTLVQELLAHLLARAHDLPDTQPSLGNDGLLEQAPSDFRSGLRAALGDSDLYWLVADPFPLDREPSLIASLLTDDLTDIYLDLKRGLNFWDNGQRQDAVWQWRFGFSAVWGRDAANALAALLGRT